MYIVLIARHHAYGTGPGNEEGRWPGIAMFRWWYKGQVPPREVLWEEDCPF